MLRRLAAVALAALPLVASGQDAGAPAVAPTAAPRREGVYVGVGLGTSGLLSGGDAEALVAYRIRLGMTRSPRVQLGLEVHRAESGGSELYFTDVSATVFPFDRILFGRAGFGFSSIQRVHAATGFVPGAPLPTVEGGSGVNVLFGLGAQLGHANGLNLTVNLEAQAHRLKPILSDGHSTETTVSAWLGAEWH